MTDPEPSELDDAGVSPPAAEPSETSVSAALENALADTPHLPRDRALIALARRYAALIDDATDRLSEASEVMAETDGQDGARDFGRMVMAVSRIGPRLEAVLDRLAMSPQSRRGEGGAHAPDDPAAATLGILRSAYAARVDLAAAVDPAVTSTLT